MNTATSRIFGIVLAAAAFVALAMLVASPAETAPGDSADLRVVKSDSPDPVAEGSVLTYTIQVTNLGPQAATETTVTDRLPSSVEFVSAGGGTCDRNGRNVTCDVGTLAAAGGTATVTIRVRPGKAGTLTNTASVDSVEDDPVAANSDDAEATTVTSAPAPPAPATCRGVPVTVKGTAGSDALVGTAGPDVVAAFGGHDEIATFAGRDLICAGPGNDTVNSGTAADRVLGAAGRDRLNGRGGPDALLGNAGNDHLRGNRGSDRLRGGRGFDRCRGGAGADTRRSCEGR